MNVGKKIYFKGEGSTIKNKVWEDNLKIEVFVIG